MTIIVEMLRREATPEMVGLIPHMLHEDDKRPAVQQFDENYAHGGGWRPFAGFTMGPDFTLTYPDDPPVLALALIRFNGERVVIYEHAWVAIIQPDDTYQVARMD